MRTSSFAVVVLALASSLVPALAAPTYDSSLDIAKREEQVTRDLVQVFARVVQQDLESGAMLRPKWATIRKVASGVSQGAAVGLTGYQAYRDSKKVVNDGKQVVNDGVQVVQNGVKNVNDWKKVYNSAVPIWKKVSPREDLELFARLEYVFSSHDDETLDV